MTNNSWKERTELLLGKEKADRLAQAHVLIVGLGGVGAYAAEMNGLDAVVFTAGIGENNPHLREMVCENMEYYGIELDKELNNKMLRQSNIVKLSTDNSKVAVYLIPTNEELVIARDTEALVNAKA